MISLLTRIAATSTDVCQAFCNSNDTGLPKVSAGQSQITIILRFVFGIIGVVAVIYIILAGIRLATSIGSDPQAFAKARNTLIFAGVGLAIAISAEAIVTLVLGRL